MTDSQIKAVSDTNIDLVAVGQIPVLATNVDYQIIFTNGGGHYSLRHVDTDELTNRHGWAVCLY